MFGKSKKHYAIALDIGTEYVKVLIFHVQNDIAHVIGTGKQKQQLSDMQGGRVTDIYGVTKNCEAALEQAFLEAKVAPRQCVIGIAGELVKGATTTIHYRRENPSEKITIKELREIIDQVQERAFDKIKNEIVWETGQTDVDVKLVNSAVVDVKIDGYKITNPVGFQGRDILVGIFNAFAPIVHMGAIQTIAEELKLDLLSIVAEPYAVAKSVGLEDSAEFSSIFIDIGGGTTDIAVVRGGGLEGTKMFGIGGRVFTKSIADATDKTFSEAEKLKLDYSAGKIDKDSELGKLIRRTVQENCEVWLSGVELALEEFTNVEMLPSKIMLCGGGSLLPEISEFLLQKGWSENLPFSRRPKVDFIKPTQVATVKDETGKLKGAQDITPMALANLAIDLAGDEKVSDGIMDKILSGLRS